MSCTEEKKVCKKKNIPGSECTEKALNKGRPVCTLVFVTEIRKTYDSKRGETVRSVDSPINLVWCMYDTRRRLGSHPRLILGHPFCGFATRQNRNPNCSWKFHRHHGLNKLLSWRIVYYLLCFNILGSFTLRLYFFFSSTNPSPFFIKWIKNRISATRTFLLMNPAAFHASFWLDRCPMKTLRS